MEGLRHHVVQLECCGPVSVYVQVISNNLECFDREITVDSQFIRCIKLVLVLVSMIKLWVMLLLDVAFTPNSIHRVIFFSELFLKF